jgi:dTDP-4-dehydrorhamnose 3,5-epimerase
LPTPPPPGSLARVGFPLSNRVRKVSRIELQGVRLVDLSSHADERGSLTETFREAWLPEGAPAMVQSNLSISVAGVLRGMHVHHRQSDYWCVLHGRAFVALVDLRRGSPTEGESVSMTIDAEDQRRAIYIPPGVAHGFCALTDVSLQYVVDAYFTGDDEHGFAWDDPDAAIGWPIEDPRLSARDRSNQTMAQARLGVPPFATPGH